jgi:hypothetical protein
VIEPVDEVADAEDGIRSKLTIDIFPELPWGISIELTLCI